MLALHSAIGRIDQLPAELQKSSTLSLLEIKPNPGDRDSVEELEMAISDFAQVLYNDEWPREYRNEKIGELIARARSAFDKAHKEIQTKRQSILIYTSIDSKPLPITISSLKEATKSIEDLVPQVERLKRSTGINIISDTELKYAKLSASIRASKTDEVYFPSVATVLFVVFTFCVMVQSGAFYALLHTLASALTMI